MSHEVYECVVPIGCPLRYPVTHDLQIVFGLTALNRCLETAIPVPEFARHSVINAKLEDAIAVGPHVVNVSKAGSNERSGGERK
jgi:hypothetical protein